MKHVNITQWVRGRRLSSPIRPKASHQVGSRTEGRSLRGGVRSRGKARTQAVSLNPESCRVPDYAASSFDPPAIARRTFLRMRHNSEPFAAMIGSNDYIIHSIKSGPMFGLQPLGALCPTLHHPTPGTGLSPRIDREPTPSHGQLEPLAHTDGSGSRRSERRGA